MRKLRVADKAVADDLPTPTPSRTRCVASTDRRFVERSCTRSYRTYDIYPCANSVSHWLHWPLLELGVVGRKVLRSMDWMCSSLEDDDVVRASPLLLIVETSSTTLSLTAALSMVNTLYLPSPFRDMTLMDVLMG